MLSMLRIEKARCEYLENPIGIGEKTPRFSWIINSERGGIEQTKYRLQVSLNKHFLAVLWDSDIVESSNSIHVEYKGPTLQSSTTYYYRVKIWDNYGEVSPWSEGYCFETGLLNNEWAGNFISVDSDEHEDNSKGKYLRHKFSLKKNIIFARVYSTAFGMYELHLNGERVGESVFAPGWTNYTKRLQYQTYDVTHMVKEGDNALGAILGCGWYKGDLAGWTGRRNIYGNRSALLLQMLVRYADGSEEVIVSDESWTGSEGPILYSELYHGEIYDATLEEDKWITADFNDDHWNKVYKVPQDLSIIVPQDGVDVVPQEALKPIELIITPKGEKVLDFGQNLAGWVKFKVKGKAGDKVILKHGEVLDSEGNFYTANLRGAKARVEYILKGKDIEIFQPHFTFQGFRYVEIVSYPGDIDLENFQAIVIHSAIKQIGEFECSNPLVNQLSKNILWGLKGNFIDVPTDCPQRDERLGWTGDAQVFVRTACLLMDVPRFYRKWLRDLKSNQLNDGGVPYVIPDVLTGKFDNNGEIVETGHSSTGWGDAAVICPWTLYISYGDKRVLEEQYDSMKSWVNYIREQAEGGVLWNTGFHFGDWVALDAKEGSSFGATPNDLTATAYYAYCADIMSKVANILGENEDEKYFSKLHNDITKAFQNEFYTPNGRLAARTQTSHILALMFNLVPEEYKSRTLDTLLELIKENNGHLTTGFLGTPYICKVLSDNGRVKEAYDLLLKEDYPSWLYQVKKGATTIWEHWDGIKPDGTMWNEAMNSFNHYAYGSIGEWLYRVVAGLEISENNPGYKHTIIKPQPGGNLTFAGASYESLYGKVAVSWEIKDGNIIVKAQVPHNTTAEIRLPSSSGDVYATYNVGSGKYVFEYKY